MICDKETPYVKGQCYLEPDAESSVVERLGFVKQFLIFDSVYNPDFNTNTRSDK